MVGVGRGALTGRARRGLRRHWGFAVLLVLAAALRVVVFLAYQPALIFPDSVRYLQFRSSIQADASAAALGYRAPAVRHRLARFLTGYGRWFYVPGPVFAGGLVLALAGLTAGARRRRDEQASAALLFTASAVLVLIPPALFATFDWRYRLPQLTLIPVAAVIGGRLITRPRRASGGRARRTRPAAAESGLRVPGGR